MARIRSIKPEFWTDSLMVQLPHFTRLLYVGLWNVADDYGFIRDEPDRLAMELMPRESPSAVDAAVQLLAAAGRLEWFVDPDGTSYYRVSSWEKHQRVDHPSPSKISRESSRKVVIPLALRRDVATKYGCEPGKQKAAECFYCGKPGSIHWFPLADGRPSSWVSFPELELDHLESEHEGGATSVENIVLACRSCNRGKGAKHWFDFFSSRTLANPRALSRALAPEVEVEGNGTEGIGSGRERKGTVNGGAHAAASQFAAFWAVYPKKKSKGDAERAWAKIKPSSELAERIVSAVAKATTCPDWSRDDGKFIPHPATWLNGKRWEDDFGDAMPQDLGMVV